MRKEEQYGIGLIMGAIFFIGGYYVMRKFERNTALKWFAKNTKISMEKLSAQDNNWILGRYNAYRDQEEKFYYKGNKKNDFAAAGWYNTKTAKRAFPGK